jgi:membrane protease YdiL (CAAX protease family)
MVGAFSIFLGGEDLSDSAMMIATSTGFLVSSLFMARKHYIGSLSPKRLSAFAVGIVLGFGFIALSFYLINQFGGLELVSWNAFSDVGRSLLISFLVFVLVAFGEEMFFRGFMLEYFKSKMTLAKSLVISSLIFGIFHAGNPGVFTTPFTIINILLIGLFFAYAKELTGSLWIAIGLHLAWNFSQGNIFGFAASGESVDSLAQITLTGSSLINGGDFGAEGSVVTTVMMLTTCVVCHFILKKKMKK